MSIDKEEEVAVLYALHKCGGKGSKARVIGYVVQNELLLPRDGDNIRRQNNEPAIENDLARSRQNLKAKGELDMPEQGIWQITPKGKERLLRVAGRIAAKRPEDRYAERCSQRFHDALVELAVS